MLSEAYTTRQFYGERPVAGEALSLSLAIGPASFMYAISTQQFRVVREIGHVHASQPVGTGEFSIEQLQLVLQNFFLHQKPFEKVNIALLNRQFTMVPEAYSQEDLKPLLRFASGATAVKTAQRHRIKGMYFCYSPELDLVNYLEKTFANASIRHAGAINLGLLFNQHSLAGSQVFLNIGDACMELAIRREGELLFYNVFPFETNEDILYYLLFSFEQFGLDALQAKLSIAAQRPPADALMTAVRKYIKQVSLCVHDPSVNLTGGEMQQLPHHYYFTLLNQHLCGL